MEYIVKEKNIWLIIPATNSGKFRFKKRKNRLDFGETFSTRECLFDEQAYLEWQIGYDVPVKDVGGEEKNTKLNKKSFIGSNGKIKYPYELSEIFYTAIELNLIPKEDQDTFLKFQFQLINLKTLLQKHRLNSKFFSVLETNANRSVQYRSLDLNVLAGRVTIGGIAPSYSVLAEQLAAYDRMSEVLRYQISSARAAENGIIDFNVTLFLNPTVFAQQ